MPTDPSLPSDAPLTPNTSGHGLELSPSEWNDVILSPLTAMSAVLSLNVQTHDSYGPVFLPKMTAAALGDSAWAGPNEAVAEVDLATAGPILLDRGVKALKCVPRIASETMRSSVGSPIDAAQTAIISEMVKVLDPALIRGSTASGIGGLLGSAGANLSYTRTVTDAVTTNASASLTSATAAFTSADAGKTLTGTGIPANTVVSSVTNATTVVMSHNATADGTGVHVVIASTESIFDNLQDALTTALDAWARPTVWLVNTRTLGALYKVKDQQGRPLIASAMAAPAGPNAGPGQLVTDVIFGRRVIATPAVPAGTALLIDESQVHIGRDRDFEVRILDQLYAGFDQLGLLIVSRWDVGVVNDYGVVAVTGIA